MSRWLAPDDFHEVFNETALATANHLAARFPGIAICRYATEGHVEFKLTGEHFHALGTINDRGEFSFSMLEGNGLNAVEAILQVVKFK